MKFWIFTILTYTSVCLRFDASAHAHMCLDTPQQFITLLLLDHNKAMHLVVVMGHGSNPLVGRARSQVSPKPKHAECGMGEEPGWKPSQVRGGTYDQFYPNTA